MSIVQFKIPEQILFSEKINKIVNAISISETNWDIETVIHTLISENGLANISDIDKMNLSKLIIGLWEDKYLKETISIKHKCKKEVHRYSRRGISRGSYNSRYSNEYNIEFIKLFEKILTNIVSLTDVYSSISEDNMVKIKGKLHRFNNDLKNMKVKSNRFNKSTSSKRFVKRKEDNIYPFVLLVSFYGTLKKI